MAKQADEAVSEKKKINDDKKNLKNEQKQQRREVKRRAKEIAKREEDLDDEEGGNGLVTFGATLFIVILWLAVICVIIKLDIGGFGSNILSPILKNVPVVNKILPKSSVTETTDSDAYGGYSSLKDAVEQIKRLELELEQAQNNSKNNDDELANLKAEVQRLQEFEKKQLEFQRIKQLFDEEVVYSDKGPGAEAFVKYYEAMDPSGAEYLYKQVVAQLEESKEVQDYAAAYSQMKPKQAAAIIEAMTDNLDLASRILKVMTAEERGAILGAMDPTVAAKLTKIMDPES